MMRSKLRAREEDIERQVCVHPAVKMLGDHVGLVK